MSLLIVAFGVVAAVALVSAAFTNFKAVGIRAGAGVAGLLLIVIAFYAASFRYVGEDEAGIVIKNFGTQKLPPGQIIATKGETGPQAAVLGPGWHPWLWPFVYDIEIENVIEISDGEVGLITTTDGKPLPESQIYAPQWGEAEFEQMLKAEYFLGEGGGYKGPQASVLTPGKYRLNPKLYRVDKKPVTNIQKATVGVVKSNVGPVTSANQDTEEVLVDRGQRGIWREPLLPQEYYLNTNAYEVTTISTAERTVRYTKAAGVGEEREITVRSSDGFTFPVDVRIEYRIRPVDAPLVVAKFGDDGEQLLKRLTSAVRAIFRNNAESVKALDYVQQRSKQETQSVQMLASAMEDVGVTVTAVRIGDVGDEQTLGPLLKTQTDREIAIQEQQTFQEQQRTAEQKKELTRTQQEAEEEKRLATAAYEVQIAEEESQRRIIEAKAEAEAVKIKAQAQADAYQLIAQQIGKGNAALVELLKIVGEQGVEITPRVMVIGGGNGAGSTSDAETTALIGTMLDSMISRTDDQPRTASGPQSTASAN
jgi:uncharacterized membrane protein YqiK